MLSVKAIFEWDCTAADSSFLDCFLILNLPTHELMYAFFFILCHVSRSLQRSMCVSRGRDADKTMVFFWESGVTAHVVCLCTLIRLLCLIPYLSLSTYDGWPLCPLYLCLLRPEQPSMLLQLQIRDHSAPYVQAFCFYRSSVKPQRPSFKGMYFSAADRMALLQWLKSTCCILSSCTYSQLYTISFFIPDSRCYKICRLYSSHGGTVCFVSWVSSLLFRPSSKLGVFYIMHKDKNSIPSYGIYYFQASKMSTRLWVFLFV